MITYTDRSRILAYQRCPRRRWWEYHFEGKGIVPNQVAVPLATGGAIHLGLQRLLEGAHVDEAVQDALRTYKDMVAFAGFQDTRPHDQEYLVNEQLALTEVMVRSWALKRLPRFLELYNILEVEEEQTPAELAVGIHMLKRPDGVFENKHTFFLETLSFKTAKQYNAKNEKANINDIQGISETWGVAQKYGEHRLGPVLMEFLVTGPRLRVKDGQEDPVSDAIWDMQDDQPMEPVGAPLRWQWNPLIRAWKDNYGNISWRYKMPDPQDLSKMPTMAKFFNPHYGKKPSKDAPVPRYEVRPFAVWEEMPIKAWFDKMAAREVFPQWVDPFEKMFVSGRYARMPFELKEWQHEAGIQEGEIAAALDLMQDPELRDDLMAQVFPKYRHSCQYPTPCPFNTVCWEGMTDPLASGKFRYRTPNHPQERQQ